MRWLRWIVVSLLPALVGWGQQFEVFTARQGVAAALQRAQQDGFSDATLFWIVYAGELGQFPVIRPQFDLASGEASYWVYGVRSAQRDTTLLYAVVKLSFIGYRAIPLTSVPAPPGMVMQPLPAGWMDSDSLVLLLRQEPTYLEFRQRYPDSVPDFVTLGMSMVPEVLDLIPVWTVAFIGSPQDPATSMTCFAWRAERGEVRCLSGPTGMEGSPAGASVRFFPQPASRWVEVELPELWCGQMRSAELYDLLGRQLFRWELLPGLCRYRLTLPPTAGMYLVRLTGEASYIQRPLVVLP